MSRQEKTVIFPLCILMIPGQRPHARAQHCHMKKFEWVVEKLQDRIDVCLQEGKEFLPTQEELCREYQVSRVTVRRALQLLEADGCIESRQGSGSRLTGRSPSKERNRIALLLPSAGLYLYPSIHAAIREAAVRRGYDLLLWETDNDYQKERQILTELAERPPRGLLAMEFSILPSPNADLYRQLEEAGCHVVLLFGKGASLSEAHSSSLSGTHMQNHSGTTVPEFAGVMADYSLAAGMAVKRLSANGHRQIAGIFRIYCTPGFDCCSGFLGTMRELDFPVARRRLLLPGPQEVEEILRTGSSATLEAFLLQAAQDATAILTDSDLTAYTAAAALRRHGISIPQNISIVSIGASYLGRQSALHIDSYAPDQDIGEAALQLLVQQMTGHPAETVLLSWKEVPGNSVRVIH